MKVLSRGASIKIPNEAICCHREAVCHCRGGTIDIYTGRPVYSVYKSSSSSFPNLGPRNLVSFHCHHLMTTGNEHDLHQRVTSYNTSYCFRMTGRAGIRAGRSRKALNGTPNWFGVAQIYKDILWLLKIMEFGIPMAKQLDL